MLSQNERILHYLESGKKITPLGAWNRFDCMRLSARIIDLRKLGYYFEVTMVKKNGKRFAQYQLY